MLYKYQAHANAFSAPRKRLQHATQKGHAKNILNILRGAKRVVVVVVAQIKVYIHGKVCYNKLYYGGKRKALALCKKGCAK